MQQKPLARRDQLVCEEIGTELLIYDKATARAHSLASVAATVWQLADGDSSIEQIAARSGLGVEAVHKALDELEHAGLVTLGDGAALEGGARISRREMTKRIAGISGLAVGAPLVFSAIAPTAALAASGCGPAGQQIAGANGGCGGNAGQCGAGQGQTGTTHTGTGYPTACACYNLHGTTSKCIYISNTNCIVYGGACVLGLTGTCCAGSSYCTGAIALTCSA